ncbi:MAG: alanine/glycine:cation symporter family protein [Lacipirellulaceae bacterium]
MSGPLEGIKPSRGDYLMSLNKLRFFLILTIAAFGMSLAFASTTAVAQEKPAGEVVEAGEEASVEQAEASEEGEQELSFIEQWKANWDDPDKSNGAKAQDSVNQVFNVAVPMLESVLFYEVPLPFKENVAAVEEQPEDEIKTRYVTMPLILVVLILGGVFFTFRYGFVNVRMFGHCIQVIRGKYDRPDDQGEVSHFQALTSALSATVGLGNIAGVGVAITLGGPGAVFWMWLIAFFGMSMKFTSCSLAQYYRRVKPDGSVLGGPMVYLEDGFRDRLPALAPLGRLLAIVYAALTVMAAFGGGNMFQGNQTYNLMEEQFPNVATEERAWVFGVLLAILVGVVIIGGIRRIGEVTSKLIPLMCVGYCLACLAIILKNYQEVPAMFSSIFSGAFAKESIYGGFFGVLLQGAKRAAFSNEAGLGSAAIAHSAAKTDEPIREGIVAMIGPFIDTIVVCTMTALAILISAAHLTPDGVVRQETEGVLVTARALASLGPAVPYVLCIAVFFFAYSTLISWSYYGERAVEYLFGPRGITPYRVVYLLFVVFGPILSLDAVINFSDMMLFSMSFPNIIGMVLLSGLISKKGSDYIRRLKSGEMKPVN